MNRLRLATATALMLMVSAYSQAAEKTDTTIKTVTKPAASPEFYRFQIGTKAAIALRDGEMQAPNDNTLIAVGRTREESVALLTAAGLPGDTLDLPINPLLLRDGDRIILFDAGAGAAMGSNFGKLPTSLRAAGIEPSAVTDVMISHGHSDHVAGLVRPDRALTFPNASIHISIPEWRAIQSNADLAALVTAITPKVLAFQSGATLAPGVKAVASAGHTPGHTGYEIVSGEDRLLYFGDTLVHPVFSTWRPSWRLLSDGDSSAATASRIALLNRAADENLRLYGVHFPFPSIGRIRREGETFVWVPEAPAP